MDAFTYRYLVSVSVSQSLFYQVLNAVSYGVFERRNNIRRHLKRIVTETQRWTSVFYRYECISTCRRQEFQNILGRKLCNHYVQLLLTYQKRLNMELNMMLF